MRFQFRNLPVILLAVAQAYLADAQTGFYVPSYSNVNPGIVLNFPVRVLEFDSVLSTQFVLKWDPAVLQFQEINGYGLPDMNSDKFGLTEAQDSGIVRFVWWHNGGGVTRADSSAIFNLRLKVIGTVPSSSTVEFTERPPQTFFEVAVAGGQFYSLQTARLFNGLVTVGFPISSSEPEPAAWSSAAVWPNPISADSKLWIDLAETADLTYFLSDSSGKIIFQKNISLPPGKHGMEIANPLIEQPGVYFLTLRSASSVKIIPLLVF